MVCSVMNITMMEVSEIFTNLRGVANSGIAKAAVRYSMAIIVACCLENKTEYKLI